MPQILLSIKPWVHNISYEDVNKKIHPNIPALTTKTENGKFLRNKTNVFSVRDVLSNIPHTEHIVYATAPWTSSLLQHWTIHHTAVTTALRSWRWAKDCLKHVELIQKINKTVIVASRWSFILFTYKICNSIRLHFKLSCYWQPWSIKMHKNVIHQNQALGIHITRKITSRLSQHKEVML